MTSVTLVNPSIGSALDIRLRREERRTRAFLQSVRTNLPVDDVNKVTKPSFGRTVTDETVDEAIEQLRSWLAHMASFDTDGVAIGQARHIRPGVLQSNVCQHAEQMLPMEVLDEEFFTYKGGKDLNKEFFGSGVLEYDDGSFISGHWIHGIREGYFKFDTNKQDSKVNYFEGNYVDDKLNGRVKMQFSDSTWLDGYFKDNVLHGFCRYFDANKRLTFIGMHRNGHPFGTCWKIIKGGGFVVGRVNENGELAGPDIAYIYPDTQTAFVGNFVGGDLVSARVSQITEIILDYQCIKVPRFASPKGDILYREISTYDFVTSAPMQKDPYEKEMVLAKQSMVEGAEDGLFAAKVLKIGTIIAFYQGLRRKKPENGSPMWQNEANAYKIFDPCNKEGVVDIPEEFRCLKSYCASLAHKTNHSFIPNCEFSEFQHPRFGLIPCLVAIHDIAEGEEIFVWYGYDLDYCPDWYLDSWEKGNFTIPDSMKSEYGVS